MSKDGLWDASRSYIRTLVLNQEVFVRVGMHPWEKHPEKPTRLLVTAEMFAHLGEKRTHSDGFLDYDPLREAVFSWQTRPEHEPMLETLAEELLTVAFQNPKVEACRVKILKPDIFNEAEAAGIEIYRLRIHQ